ncbi:MAG: zinc-binding dehydrogenase [Gammaproteobacteria bacterium]|nr:zinc-binding dehydrogenase [Gammaproteobacteria bacterium]
MKALYVVAGPEGGKFRFDDAPVTDPGPGQARVRVRASGLNRGVVMFLAAQRGDGSRVFPMGIVEFAGEVDALGEGVEGVSVGDRVMARGPDAAAEFVNLDARFLVPVPADWSWEQAAAVPNVFVTSHDAVVTNGRLQPGESLLVTGGASGVGTATLQIARLLGASPVIATTRTPGAKGATLEELGADLIVDTTEPDWPELVRKATDDKGVDVVIDTVGAPLLAGNLDAMALCGRLVSVGRTGGTTDEIDLDLVALKRLQLIGVTFRTRTVEEDIACSRRFAEDLLGALDDGRLRPVLHGSFPWEEIEAAYASMAEDNHIGKIVAIL